MKTLSITIDGQALVFGPLRASTLEKHQADLGRMQSGQMTNPAEALTLVTTIATASLSRVDPSITREAVADMVDLGNHEEFFKASFLISVPDPLPGEKKAGSP